MPHRQSILVSRTGIRGWAGASPGSSCGHYCQPYMWPVFSAKVFLSHRDLTRVLSSLLALSKTVTL